MSGLEVPSDGDEVPDRETRITLGRQLSAARDNEGLSVEDIANRLNLRSSFVSAVEDGRGDEHMDWVYERNHIRAIAALLSIDVESSLQGEAT